LFGEQDRERVNRAVQEAESKTSAEILPVIARSSGRYDRAEDVVGLWLAAVAIVVVWAVFPHPGEEPGSWDGIAPIWQLATLLACAFAGFLAGALIGSRVDALRRLFAPRAQMRDEVNARARAVFYDKRVHHTAGASGVLLYVSLFERMAAVVADQAVLDKLGQEPIDAICGELIERLRKETPVDALCDTARLLGERLAPVLPRRADDANELADALVEID